MVNVLCFSPKATYTPHSTALWHSTVHVPMTTHQIAHWEPSWQPLRAFKWKDWSELYKILQRMCDTILYSMMGQNEKLSIPLHQSSVFIFSLTPRGRALIHTCLLPSAHDTTVCDVLILIILTRTTASTRQCRGEKEHPLRARWIQLQTTYAG